MNVLKICITYSCPFKCYFCYYKDKIGDLSVLEPTYLDEFLSKNHKKFDKFVISGGEPSLMVRSYLKSIIDVLKKYTNNIEIETYPIIDSSFFDDIEDVEINVSYDITARAKIQEVWKNLLKFKKPFDITVTLSPLVFRFNPNKILQILNMIPMVKHVYFKPFFNNTNYKYNIKNSDYKKFVSILENSKLNVHFAYEYAKFNNEFVLNPYGKLFSVQFDENGNRVEKEISTDDISACKTNYPIEVIL